MYKLQEARRRTKATRKDIEGISALLNIIQISLKSLREENHVFINMQNLLSLRTLYQYY